MSSEATTIQSFASGHIYATTFANALSFHYTLSVMMGPTKCIKYHATELINGHFTFQAIEHDILVPPTLCVALKIGDVQKYTTDQIKELLEPISMTQVPDCDEETEPKFTCRVWVKEAIRVLNTAGIISCSDADAVVNTELRTYAFENEAAIKEGFGAPKVYVSQHSA